MIFWSAPPGDTGVGHVISKLFKCGQHDPERPAPVMDRHDPRSFDDERRRLLRTENPCHVKEERTGPPLSGVFPGSRVFRSAVEGRCRQTGQQHVMVGHASVDLTAGFRFRDVIVHGKRYVTDVFVKAVNRFIRIMVGLVGTDRERVPFTRQDAASASLFETAAHSANACKQVDEIEIRLPSQNRRRRQQGQQVTVFGTGKLRRRVACGATPYPFGCPDARHCHGKMPGDKAWFVNFQNPREQYGRRTL